MLSLQLNPDQPLAIHIYIHVAEASSPLKCALAHSNFPSQSSRT